MLTALWTKFQGWIITAGAFVALLVTAYIKGRSDQKDITSTKETKKRIDDIKQAREIEDEVKKLPRTDLDRRLDKWMRD